MTDADPSPEANALARLAGSLLMTSGLMIILLCGGCTLNVLRMPGGQGAIPFAMFFGGIPIAIGACVSYVGYRMLPRTQSAAQPLRGKDGTTKVIGWGLVAVGLAITAFAGYEMFWDLWVLLHAFNNTLAGAGGGLAFAAALEHSLLFALAAGAVEFGRRTLQAK